MLINIGDVVDGALVSARVAAAPGPEEGGNTARSGYLDTA
jgi:hypothetical protein